MKQWIVVSAVAGVALAAGAWWEAERQEAAARSNSARVFETAVTTIRQEFVNSVGPELYDDAARAVVGSLGDPYSELLTGERYRRYRRQVTGEEIVVGDVSTERSGALGPGDVILEIDGQSTVGWSRSRIERALDNGPPGSSLTVTIRPNGSDTPVQRTLTRSTAHVPATSPGVMLGDGIGYVALYAVSEGSAHELRKVLERLTARGMRGLVLDLRRNPGGLIDQGVEIAGLFLPIGTTVGIAHGRSASHDRVYTTPAFPSWPSLPLVLLVDGASASAAELIAGALQDHDRAVVVGTPSFGKGVLQTTYPLDVDVALKLTTARWFTPSGRSLQRPAGDSRALNDMRPIRHWSDAGRPLPDSSGIVPDLRIRRGKGGDEPAVAHTVESTRAPSDRQVRTATRLLRGVDTQTDVYRAARALRRASSR